MKSDSAQYLTFQLARETYGLRILSVKEIIEYDAPTKVPMMPEVIRGVINIRGAVLPVVDLCVRFGRPPSAPSKRSCIVIVEHESARDRQDMGLLVDAVHAVVEIAPGDIAPPPSFGTGIPTRFIEGVGKVDDRLVILIDVASVLELGALMGMTEATDDHQESQGSASGEATRKPRDHEHGPSA